MRVVVDTNVMVSAFLFGGAPSVVVSLAQSSVIELVTCEAALLELLGVLSRPKFARHLSANGLVPEEMVARYWSLASVVEPGGPLGICSDQNDEVFIAAAVAGNADLIVSGDSHLLRCADTSPVPVVTVTEFLTMLGEDGIDLGQGA